MTASPLFSDELTRFRPDELAIFHKNARMGDVDAIAGSLHANSQYKPILVNRGTFTGRPLEVLAGNHTLKAIRNLAQDHPDDPRWSSVLTYVIDVDNDRATRIVAADNRTAELGHTDDALLAELLADLDGDLAGTAYTEDDLAALPDPDQIPDGSDDSGEPGERGNGEAVELWGTTVGEPDITPEPGSVWRLGIHTLVVADVNKQHALYTPHLTEDAWLYPYPSLLAPYASALDARPVVMVQPSTYLAGWLLTKWNRLRPGTPAEQVTA